MDIASLLATLKLPYSRVIAPTQWEAIRWSQLLPTNLSEWRWHTESTPLAQPSLYLTASAGYLLVILVLWMYIKGRKEVDTRLLTRISVLHNTILCVWSLAMFLGTVYAVLGIATRQGIQGAFCTQNAVGLHGPLWYWAYIYFLSKYYELLDTVIIVLRKRPLTFLHVFHHSIVLLMSWLWLEHGLTYGASFGIMFNTLVHVFMYWFYRQSALKIRVWWKKYITTLQIVQFMSSFILSLPFIYYTFRNNSMGCTGMPAFAFSCVLNAMFLFLFIRFYFAAYQPKGQHQGKKKSS